MPTYEYVCAKCGHQFEIFQSIADKPLSVCPQDRCGKKKWGKGKVKKLIGLGAGLIFKGSGFYITDYRSEGYKEAAKKEKEAGTKTEKSDKSDSTSKPAAADKGGKTASESKAAPKAETKPAKPPKTKE